MSECPFNLFIPPDHELVDASSKHDRKPNIVSNEIESSFNEAAKDYDMSKLRKLPIKFEDDPNEVTDVVVESEDLKKPKNPVMSKGVCLFFQMNGYLLGPLKQSDYEVINNKIYMKNRNDHILQPTRCKGKMRKQMTISKEEVHYWTGNGFEIGPMYEIKWGKGKYLGQIENGLPHGIGEYKSDTALYIGPWVRGKKSGLGMFVVPGGSMYHGQFRNDMRNGKGSVIFVNGEIKVMSGTWTDNVHGGPMCHIEYSNGNHYYGSVVNNFIRHGLGSLECADGSMYVDCDWVNDKRNGSGILYRPDGTKIICQWANDKACYPFWMTFPNKADFFGEIHSITPFNATGKITYVNQDIYDGEIQNEKRHGTGVMTYAEGPVKTCRGTWVDGELEGSGCYIKYANDESYMGSVKNRQRNGYGVYFFTTGIIYKCQWIDSEIKDGLGNIVFPGGVTLEGQFKKGLMQNPLKITFPNKDRFEGSVTTYNPLCGKGTLYYYNGDIYKGELCQGERDGYGIYTFGPSESSTVGDRLTGYWCSGKKHGYITHYHKLKSYYTIELWENDMLVVSEGKSYYAD